MDDDEESEEFTEALVYIGFNRVTAEAMRRDLLPR